jgi:hypothetical protein
MIMLRNNIVHNGQTLKAGTMLSYREAWEIMPWYMSELYPPKEHQMTNLGIPRESIGNSDINGDN